MEELKNVKAGPEQARRTSDPDFQIWTESQIEQFNHAMRIFSQLPEEDKMEAANFIGSRTHAIMNHLIYLQNTRDNAKDFVPWDEL